MITCFKGNVTVKGSGSDVVTDYISITRTMIDLLNETVIMDNLPITDEKKVAAQLMAIIGTALAGSKLSDRKEFYEGIKRLATFEAEGRK